MKHALAWIATLALAACGSKSAPPAPPNPPAAPDAAPIAEAPPPTPAPPDAALPDAAPPPRDLLADERAAYDKAKPLFDQYCAKCHTQTGKNANKKKLGHFDMTSYPFGGHHAKTIGTEIREVLGLSGEKVTMPDDKPGAVKGDDLATIDAWARAWLAADAAGLHK